jgi:hypothetical protein
MDPVDPSAQVKLDPQLLDQFPVGYRHLGYLQSTLGFEVKTTMPGLQGPEADALYAQGAQWLAGGSCEGAKV